MGDADFTSERPISPQMVVVKSKGNGTPAISGKSRLVKYYSIWPDPLLCHTVKVRIVTFLLCSDFFVPSYILRFHVN